MHSKASPHAISASRVLLMADGSMSKRAEQTIWAVGAIPMCPFSVEEIETLVSHAGSVCLYMENRDADTVLQLIRAMQWAKQYKKPVVLDLTNIALTPLRMHMASQVLKSVSVLRGEGSEIMALAEGKAQRWKRKKTECDTLWAGAHSDAAVAKAARTLAMRYRCTVVVTAVHRDFMTDGVKEDVLPSSMQGATPRIAGQSSSVIATFLGKSRKKASYAATHAAMELVESASRAANQAACGPASFDMHFIDQLATYAAVKEQASPVQSVSAMASSTSSGVTTCVD